VELLDEAKARCEATIKERRGDDITPEELEDSSSVMGYGAVKYADLKNNRSTNYKCAHLIAALVFFCIRIHLERITEP
jgi:arginyl-tRNA synthetase